MDDREHDHSGRGQVVHNAIRKPRAHWDGARAVPIGSADPRGLRDELEGIEDDDAKPVGKRDPTLPEIVRGRGLDIDDGARLDKE